MRKNAVIFLVVLAAFSATAAAQTSAAAVQVAPAPVVAEGVTILGPPPPLPPETINRDAEGRATIRAVRITSPLTIDGRLDEEIYLQVPPMSDFIQNDPKEGAPASEKTDVWLFYDQDNVYIVARCWESHPERLNANEMRRDNVNIVQNDEFAWSFDTFYNRRDVVIFEVSAAGGRIDGQVTNERQVTLDWNPIWVVKTGKFDGGWVVEAAIPFKSLRYKRGSNQVWGFQARRHSQWRNEFSFLTPIPASVGSPGHFRASLAATLLGIEAPQGLLNLDIKPYATSHLTTDKTVRPELTNDPGGAVGLDAKYGVTQSLAADITVNTDFAQVEADEQQVNLTRFNLFFPEKRDFFLENAGVFQFGNVVTSGAQAGVTDTPILFYSRQIGLSRGREVPIRVGGRLTGRVGPYAVGVLDVESGREPIAGTPRTNFSVLRLKRDVLGKSNIGMMFTGRSVGQDGRADSESYGVDGSFNFKADLAINMYWARTKRDGVSGDDQSYHAILDYEGDRYGVQAENLVVGKNFDPQIGFVRRLDMNKTLGMFRFSPRPKNARIIRKYFWQATVYNIQNSAKRRESTNEDMQFQLQLQNSDVFQLGYTQNYEFLPRPFAVARDVIFPARGYDFGSGRIGYNFGRQRNLSGNVLLDYGAFFDGHKTTFSATSGRVNVGPQISVEPGVTINKIDVVEGNFVQRLITSRVTYTMTPLMFASALLQYNSITSSVAANVRFRWEYQPGSELFLVYNEQRDTLAPSFPDLMNRSFIVKINRVFRF